MRAAISTLESSSVTLVLVVTCCELATLARAPATVAGKDTLLVGVLVVEEVGLIEIPGGTTVSTLPGISEKKSGGTIITSSDILQSGGDSSVRSITSGSHLAGARTEPP